MPDELLSEEPEDKREPDMYVIQLSGEHQKCGSPATVTINKWVDQWLQKFRQIKAIAHGDCYDSDEDGRVGMVVLPSQAATAPQKQHLPSKPR